MGEVINCARRPLTVLVVIGAVVGFALVVVPGGTDLAAASPGDSISVNSTVARASVQIQLVIAQLPTTLASGSSVVLYLEDGYDVPSGISGRYAWFTVSGAPASGNADDRQAQLGRHYLSDPIEIDTDASFHNIRAYIPDMYLGDVTGISRGFQGPVAGETLTLTISKSAGIKNPSVPGSHSLGYSILGPDDDAVPRTPQYRLPDAKTFAKFGMSHDSGRPGQVVTVSGSGFNNGVSGVLYVKHYADDANGNPTAGRWTVPAAGARGTLASRGDPNAAIADAAAVAANCTNARRIGQSGECPLAVGDVMTLAETCIDIIDNGALLGHNIVGRDGRVDLEFTVANPPFRPGSKNLLCMQDGAGGTSGDDVEHFTLLPPLPVVVALDPSIRVAPNPVNAGDAVTVVASGFSAGAIFRWLEVAGERVDPDAANPLGSNGKGSLTFAIPGKWQGTIKVSVCYAAPGAASCHQASAPITVNPAQLSVSRVEVRPNENIIVRGRGFSKTPGTTLASARIGGVDLLLVSHGGDLANVEVSGRQFTATFAVWPANPADYNPALEDGTHTIEITDQEGFSGTVDFTILTPTLSITPAVASPGGQVTITGTNWPVANSDGGAVSPVKLEITGGDIDADTMDASTDADGRWSVRYPVPGNIRIPATMSVRASYGEQPDQPDDIVSIVNFSVQSASLSVAPNQVSPGAALTLNAAGFAGYESNITVKIGNFDVAVPPGAAADGEGKVRNLTVTVPALDAGSYTVRLQVGGTVASSKVTVGDEHHHGNTALPDALAPLGNNMVRVFYFDNATKTWSFYDPRPEFAELNTLTILSPGAPYWVLVRRDQDVTLNFKRQSLACQGGNCWSLIVW